MSQARPDVYPDWAVNSDGTDNDIVDTISGENNVVPPDAGKQASGFLYREKPARQSFNWLGRKTTQWLRYLDGLLTANTGSFTLYLGDATVNTPLLFHYAVVGGIVSLRWGDLDVTASLQPHNYLAFIEDSGAPMPVFLRPRTPTYMVTPYVSPVPETGGLITPSVTTISQYNHVAYQICFGGDPDGYVNNIIVHTNEYVIRSGSMTYLAAV